MVYFRVYLCDLSKKDWPMFQSFLISIGGLHAIKIVVKIALGVKIHS